MTPRILVVPVLAVALVLAAPTSSFAAKSSKGGGGGGGGGGSKSTGYDVSYPQCGGALPSSPLFGIVGVNDGIVYSSNPCLADEYAWAAGSTTTTRPKVSFYANTANPGPTSSHWPTGATFPRACPADTLTADCSYDYGWNAAEDAYSRAASVSGTAPAQAAPWWLDVETANSWTTDAVANSADIQGALDYLATSQASGGAGVTGGVGIYTNSSSWQSITGSTAQFAGYPSWVPGARTLTQAQGNCNATITGGRVVYAQYPSGGFDADYVCP